MTFKIKDLKQIMGGHTVKYGKIFKTRLENGKAKCQTCNTNKLSLCCN